MSAKPRGKAGSAAGASAAGPSLVPRSAMQNSDADAAGALLYLYCITEAGTPAHQLLIGGTVPGLEQGEPLFAIEADGLVAAVSRVPAASFQEEPLAILMSDLTRLAPFAVRHQKAIAALMPEAPALIPMAFGTIYEGAQRVVQLLEDRAHEFHAAMAQLRGKQEWGLKVVCDTAQAVRAAETASPELQRLDAEAAAATPGRSYLLKRRRAQLVASEADSLVVQACAALLDRLRAVSSATLRDLISGSHGENLQLVLKAAFLIDIDATHDFRTLTAELEEAVAPLGLRLELSGPWPPYSFVRSRDGAD